MDPKVADSQETGLLDLPEEVIRKVMSFLSESDRVWKIGMSCRALLQYSLLNVHQIEIPFLSDSITIELLRLLLQEAAPADWIRYVILVGSRSRNLLNAAYDELPDIRHKRGTLIIYITARSDKAMLEIAENCKNLKALVMLQCNYFTNEGIGYLARQCPDITHLCINSHSLRDDGLKHILQSLTKLKYLNLKNCSQLTGKGIEETENKLRNLNELYMDGCGMVNDDAIHTIAQKCHALEILSINSCRNLTDESIFSIGSYLPGVKYLDIGRTYLGNVALKCISQSCPRLETLITPKLFRRTTSDGVGDLLRNSPHLKNLDLSYCNKQVDDEVIVIIGEFCSSLENLKLNKCLQITDFALVTLGANCVDLQYLDVRGCRRLQEHGISSLIQALPNLQIHVDNRFI